MAYEAKDFSHLKGTAGFSDALLDMHFTLYNGYVANTNKASDILKKLDKASPEFAEMKRRFGWEFNGMRLHEYYFGNLSNESSELSSESALAKALVEEFGSIDTWKEDFVATGELRGIGWVILAWDKEHNRLFNTWINEHDLGHLGGATPILIMDVFEHAFITEYGLARADYINAFMKAIDWNTVQERFK